MALIVLLATVTFTFADFVFKSEVADTVKPEDLGFFFARVYLVLNVLSLVAQLALVRPVVSDTEGVGYNDLTGGSRTTFATGMAVVEASRLVDVMTQACVICLTHEVRALAPGLELVDVCLDPRKGFDQAGEILTRLSR